MFVELSRLVVRRLEDGSSAHGGLGSRDQGEVLASDSEKNFPKEPLAWN